MKIDRDTFLLWLDDYCGGALDPAQRRAVEDYLEEHPEDRVEVHRQEALRGAFADLPRPGAPRELREGVLSRLKEEKERGMGDVEDEGKGERSGRAAVVAVGKGLDLARARAHRRRLAMRLIQVAAVAVIAVSAWRLTILSRPRAERTLSATRHVPASAAPEMVAAPGGTVPPARAAKAEEKSRSPLGPPMGIPVGSLKEKAEQETASGRAVLEQAAGSENRASAGLSERRVEPSRDLGALRTQIPSASQPSRVLARGTSQELARPVEEPGTSQQMKEGTGQALPAAPPAAWKPNRAAPSSMGRYKAGYSPEASSLADKVVSAPAPSKIAGGLETWKEQVTGGTARSSELKKSPALQPTGGPKLLSTQGAGTPKISPPPSSHGTSIGRKELGWDEVGRIPPHSVYVSLDTLQGAVRDHGGKVKETIEGETPRVVVLMKDREALDRLQTDLTRMGWRVEGVTPETKGVGKGPSVTSGTRTLMIREVSPLGKESGGVRLIPLAPPGGGRILLDVKYSP